MSKPVKIIEYSPESGIRNIGGLIKDIFKNILNSKDLILRLIIRNIKSQYRQSFLGIFWAFIPPIISSSLWIFINSFKVISIKSTEVPYPVFVLTGMILWQGFTEALSSPIRSTSSSKALLTKINFPHEALLISGIGETLFNFSIKILLLIPVYIWFNVNPSFYIFPAVFSILGVLLLGWSIGLIFTSLNMLYEDVHKGLNAVTSIWMFLTPVIYPIPDNGLIKVINQINPVTPMIMVTRNWLSGNPSAYVNEFLLVSAVSVFIGIAGLILYKISMPHIISRIGS